MSGENVREGQEKGGRGEKLSSLAKAKLRRGASKQFPPSPSHPQHPKLYIQKHEDLRIWAPFKIEFDIA